jgi:hypothetical protein
MSSRALIVIIAAILACCCCCMPPVPPGANQPAPNPFMFPQQRRGPQPPIDIEKWFDDFR